MQLSFYNKQHLFDEYWISLWKPINSLLLVRCFCGGLNEGVGKDILIEGI